MADSSNLSPDDLRQLLAAVAELYSARNIDEIAQKSVDVFNRLTPGELLHYDEIDLVRKRTICVSNDPDDPATKNAHVFSAFAHQHPLLAHMARSGDAAPVMISDVLSRADWAENELHREFFQYIGYAERDQIAFLLPGSDPSTWVAGVSVVRKWGKLTDRDREIFGLLYPHVAQAYRTARLLTDLDGRLGAGATAAEEGNAGAALLDRDGNLTWASPAAARWMTEFFSGPRTKGLPPALASWVAPKVQARFAPADGVPAAWEPLTLAGAPGTLGVRASAQRDGLMLIFTLRPAPLAEAPLPKLTSRERQVLAKLARGLSVKEVAMELRVKPTTVQTYVKAIYAAYGVSSRAELLARILGRNP